MTKQEATTKLREWYPPGSTVYTIVRSVARSGMSRTIGIVALLVDDDKVIDLHPDYAVAELLGLQMAKRGTDGVIIHGCGMDMGFSIAYDLSQVLYGDGYALKHKWL